MPLSAIVNLAALEVSGRMKEVRGIEWLLWAECFVCLWIFNHHNEPEGDAAALDSQRRKLRFKEDEPKVT